MNESCFRTLGSDPPASPVVISVPHAGRAYPHARALLAHPVERLRALEDRHADLLAAQAIRDGTSAIVARLPRLWIDLNRAESDLDPGMVAGKAAGGIPQSARMRGGLGLIPRRLAHLGEIWRRPLDPDEVARRVTGHYRPYHAALEALLDRAHDRFGTVILVDLHSMPPLAGDDAPQIVLGDRFGATAAPLLTGLAEAIFTGAGLRTAINAPYAGGHIIARHGLPRRGVHALQLEVDRRLYLDAALDAPGPGLVRMQAAIARLVTALAGELVAAQAIAAE